jgi:type IV fimbrial biogenesis protein FimT
MAAKQHHSAGHRTQRGLTLVELCVTLAVMAIIVCTVLPSFAAAIDRQTLRGVADQLESDTYWARGTAQAQGLPLRLTVQHGAGASCYVIHSGDRDDCDCLSGAGTTQCHGNAQSFKTVFMPPNARVQLAGTSSPCCLSLGGGWSHQPAALMW